MKRTKLEANLNTADIEASISKGHKISANVRNGGTLHTITVKSFKVESNKVFVNNGLVSTWFELLEAMDTNTNKYIYTK